MNLDSSKVRTQKSKIRRFLGKAELLLDPVHGMILILSVLIPLYVVSNQKLPIILAGVSSYLLFTAIRIEEDWLEVTPLPPLTVFCLGAWLRCGLGAILIAAGKTSIGNPMWEYLDKSQYLWLIVSFCTTICFILWRPNTESPKTAKEVKVNVNFLALITLICGVTTLAGVIIGALAGTMDRNPESYYFWLNKTWQPDTVITMFARFKDVFFILSPLAIAKTKSNIQRCTYISLITAYFFFAIPLGGRGLVLFPLCLLALGLWLTNASYKLIRLICIAVLVLSLSVIPAMSAYRSADTFEATKRSDVMSRISLMAATYAGLAANNNFPEKVREMGRSLYACSDGYLFKDSNLAQPRAGFHRINSFITAWIPSLILKREVPIRDSHIIAREVEGTPREVAEKRKYQSFSCISFGGDLYWRGGWLAVVIGSCIMGLMYRLASAIWYRNANWSKGWRVLLLLYPATFLVSFPVSSIGETAWLWMWDLPKYMALIFLLCTGSTLLKKFTTVSND